jgi:hypothetical protein
MEGDMTVGTDDSRLGWLEGWVEELSKPIQDLRAGQRQVLLATMGIGAAQIGLLTTLVIKTAG